MLKKEPVKENLNNSAPLNKFLLVIENFSETPNFLMLECVSSVSVPIVNFSFGVKRMSAVSKSEFSTSVNWMLIDLKFLSDFKCFRVRFLSVSL